MRTKRRMTKLWSEEFPAFTAWRPLMLLRRIGPVLQGITLDLRSSGNEYYPTARVHALITEFPVVSLTLAHRVMGPMHAQWAISADADGDVVRTAAGYLRRESLLPLDKTPTIDDILAAYLEYLVSDTTALEEQAAEVQELLLLSAYSQDASWVLPRVKRIVDGWRNAPPGFDAKEAWFEYVLSQANEAALAPIVESQARSLKVENVPILPVY